MAFVVSAVTAEVVTVASVAAAVGELGMTLSVVGAVTGSKDLMKVGGYMSLAGGVTSLAAGALSGSSGLAMDAAGEGLGGTGGALGQAGDYGMGAAAETGMSDVTPLAENTANTVINTAKDAIPVSTDASAVSNSTAGDSTFGGNAASGADQSAPTMKYGDNSMDPGAPSLGGIGQSGSVAPPTDTSSSGIVDWYKKQPDAVKAAIVRGGMSAVGGLFQGWTEEQKQALDRSKFALQQQQLANGSAQPTINFQSKPTGIINSARSM